MKRRMQAYNAAWTEAIAAIRVSSTCSFAPTVYEEARTRSE
jgi:hypothetical protein